MIASTGNDKTKQCSQQNVQLAQYLGESFSSTMQHLIETEYVVVKDKNHTMVHCTEEILENNKAYFRPKTLTPHSHNDYDLFRVTLVGSHTCLTYRWIIAW